jgi:hypothetical protein
MGCGCGRGGVEPVAAFSVARSSSVKSSTVWSWNIATIWWNRGRRTSNFLSEMMYTWCTWGLVWKGRWSCGNGAGRWDSSYTFEGIMAASTRKSVANKAIPIIPNQGTRPWKSFQSCWGVYAISGAAIGIVGVVRLEQHGSSHVACGAKSCKSKSVMSSFLPIQVIQTPIRTASIHRSLRSITPYPVIAPTLGPASQLPRKASRIRAPRHANATACQLFLLATSETVWWLNVLTGQSAKYANCSSVLSLVLQPLLNDPLCLCYRVSENAEQSVGFDHVTTYTLRPSIAASRR